MIILFLKWLFWIIILKHGVLFAQSIVHDRNPNWSYNKKVKPIQFTNLWTYSIYLYEITIIIILSNRVPRSLVCPLLLCVWLLCVRLLRVWFFCAWLLCVCLFCAWRFYLCLDVFVFDSYYVFDYYYYCYYYYYYCCVVWLIMLLVGTKYHFQW